MLWLIGVYLCFFFSYDNFYWSCTPPSQHHKTHFNLSVHIRRSGTKQCKRTISVLPASPNICYMSRNCLLLHRRFQRPWSCEFGESSVVKSADVTVCFALFCVSVRNEGSGGEWKRHKLTFTPYRAAVWEVRNGFVRLTSHLSVSVSSTSPEVTTLTLKTLLLQSDIIRSWWQDLLDV